MSNATSSDAGRSNTTKSNKAIVIGAGVGGLSAAIALRMAGLEVTVFERHTDPRVIESGGAFILWNNAMKALGHLGLADEVEAAGAVLEVAEWQTPGGRAIASWPVAEVSREVGAPALGVRRTDLQSILVRAAGSENLRLGAQCSGYTEEADGVTVHLASGEAERCDVLVGADGIRSTVRAHVGGKGQLRDAGYWQYFGIAGCETELTTSRIFREIDGRGRRFFAFPVGRGETYWAAAQTGRGDANTRVSVGTTGAKADVLSAFAGWAEPVQTLLHATEEPAIYRRQILDRDPMKAWGRGRITLLGDAAHPITPNLGQGACQAIEDAVVLARHLEGPGDLAQALRAYERSRVARTGSFVRRARMIGRMGRWRSPLSCLIRDHIAHRAIPGPALRRHRRDMAYVF